MLTCKRSHTHTKSYHLAIIWFSYQEKFSQDVVNLHSFFQELYFVCCIMCLPLSLLIFCVFIRPVFNNFVLEKIIKKRPSVYLQCPSVFQKHNLPNEKSSTCMRVAQIVYNKPWNMRINLIFFQLNVYFYLHELFMHTQTPPPTYKQRKKKKNPKERNVMHLALTTIVVMQAFVNPQSLQQMSANTSCQEILYWNYKLKLKWYFILIYTYFSPLHFFCSDNNHPRIFLPDHSPEIYYCSRKTALSGYVSLLWFQTILLWL